MTGGEQQEGREGLKTCWAGSETEEAKLKMLDSRDRTRNESIRGTAPSLEAGTV